MAFTLDECEVKQYKVGKLNTSDLATFIGLQGNDMYNLLFDSLKGDLCLERKWRKVL